MFLKQQRNILFDALTQRGFSIEQLKEISTSESYSISYKSEPQLFFRISPFDSTQYWVVARPGIDFQPEQSSGRFENWNALGHGFIKWANLLRQEVDVPDLWAEAIKTAQLFAPTAEPSDDKFTRTELAEVQGQLRLLQLSFTASALPEAAKQKLIELTETAAVKAEGLTKKDWQNWIIGGFISAITGLALNPTQAGEVLKLVKAAFGGLFLH